MIYNFDFRVASGLNYSCSIPLLQTQTSGLELDATGNVTVLDFTSSFSGIVDLRVADWLCREPEIQHRHEMNTK